MTPTTMTEASAMQGSLSLLDHPVAQELLHSTIPARLAYVALDGTPRVIPAVFQWTGEEIVLSSWPDDPKAAALRQRHVGALTIDTAEPPYRVLSLRGVAEVTMLNSMPEEILPAFIRNGGPEMGRALFEQMNAMSDQFARIAIHPHWVGVLDFETRFPSGMARRMGSGPG